MQITKIFISTLFFFLFYISLEIIKRKFKIKSEVTRKIAHLLSGVFAIIISHILRQSEFIVVSILFTIFFFITNSKKLLKSIHIHNRKTYGEIVYPIGLIILAIIFYNQKNYLTTGILILAIPDTLAGIYGYINKLITKSFQGSFLFFISSFLISLFAYDTINSLFLSLILTLVEYSSPYGLDNFFIPLTYCFYYFFSNLI